MDLTNFCWGFTGGLIVQLNVLINSFDIDKLKSLTKVNFVDKKKQIPEPIDEEREIIKKLLSPLTIFLLIFYAIAGGIMAHLIDPQIAFFAFYIGLTSSSFITKF